MIYPAKNQSNEQTEKDKFACYSWAKGQTGVRSDGDAAGNHVARLRNKQRA